MDLAIPELNRRPRPQNKLRQYREAARLNQKEMAELVGVSQAAISLAETTGKGLGDDKWESLADLLSTDVLTLRGWTKIYANS